jgi:PAS domain S-box-containing protein
MTGRMGYTSIVLGVLLLVGLYLVSLQNYLLFHGLAEVFSIVIAFSIFIIAWNARRLMENSYLLFLGIAYLFIGGLDLIHTLGYTGMGVFPGHTTNLPTQLWVGARYMESLSLLLAPLFLGRRPRAELVIFSYAVVTFIFIGTVFYWDLFPTCFVEGRGLTAFKKTSEYVISLVMLGAIAALVRQRLQFAPRVLRLLIASILITIASELAFTFYKHAYGLSNLIGHYLKIISFYLIYKALIETGLRQPYDLLFREIKEREGALRESEERYRTIFENTGTATLIIEEDATIFLVNTEFEKLTGYTKEAVEGKRNWEEFIIEDHRDKLQECRNARRDDPRHVPCDCELKIIDRGGKTRDIHVTIGLIPGTTRSVVSAMDITNLKRAEEIIIRDKETLEGMVRQRSAELMEAHEKLTEARRLSGIGLLAATVAHELRNPLGVIQTALYNIGRKRKEPALDRHLANIEKKISESDQIISNLLRYSRIKPPRREPGNLFEILSESIEAAGRRFPDHKVEVVADIVSLKEDTVDIDVVQIKEVIDNLLNNAYQAVTDVEGRIEIRGAIESDRTVAISIKDNGMGIDRDDLERVFEPFFTRKSRGTGLGLTICRELVQLHGGTVGITSEPGSGTTVTMVLPLEAPAP